MALSLEEDFGEFVMSFAGIALADSIEDIVFVYFTINRFLRALSAYSRRAA